MSVWMPSGGSRRRERAFEQVLQQIQQAIHAHELRPGDRLPPERDLAAALNVSRTSVREAIRVLEALGLVQVKVGAGPDQGVSVRDVPGDSLVQLFDMWVGLQHIGVTELVQFREAIERWSCATLAQTDEDDDRRRQALKELGAITEAMRDATSKEEYLELDTAFHVRLVSATGNRLADLVIQAIRGSMRAHMLAAFKEIEAWDEERALLTAEHLRIFQLVEQREDQQVADAVVAHVRRFYSTYVSK